MAETKVTKRMRFEEMVEVLKGCERDDLAGVILHEIELLDKKNANKTPSKATIEKRAENSRLTDLIFDYLKDCGKPCSIAEIKGGITEVAEFSSSKMASLLKPLVDSGEVEKSYIKKVVVYKAI